MKRDFILIIGLIVLYLALVGASFDEDKKIDSVVREKVLDGEEVRVFVKIKEDLRLPSNKEALKEEIIEKIGEEKIKHNFDDSISAVIDENDLKKLERDWRVASVELVGIREVFLQDSVPLINGSSTYKLQVDNLNLTGNSQTICIIDSGVNYSHPDLGGCYGNNNLSLNCKIIGGRDYCADDSSCTLEDDDPIDEHGHGTHITGIAVANGRIKGVAPESRVVMLKVCNSSGSCFDDSIKAGINWCVNNASLFNISVISLSLGAGLYSSFCDSDVLTQSINAAFAKHIPVVVATGNTGSTTHISSPACVQNATPIGSVGKDGLTINFNRNSLVRILAPGVSINSTSLSSEGYSSLSGTSMAAPHAAGAIAIIKQFLNLTGQHKKVDDIKAILNNSGTLVYDSASGNDYSRINIYKTIISIDNKSPNVTLISPSNGKISPDKNWSFFCNATDLSLKNVSFYLWNSTGIYNESSKEINGSSYVFPINISNLSEGNYKWNCLYGDENFNLAFASSNFSFSVGGISVSLGPPADENYTKSNETLFSCSAQTESSSSLKNITFYLWNSTDLIYNKANNASGLDNSSLFNYNFGYADNYKWNCLALNNNSNSSFAVKNLSIVFDSVQPNVSLIIPLDGYTVTGTSSTSFEFNVSDSYNLSRCDFILNNISLASNSSRIFINQTNSIIYNVSPGNYIWRIHCSDLAGNIGNSSDRNLEINALPLSSSDSGGGSSGRSSRMSGGGINPGTVSRAISNSANITKVGEEKKSEDQIKTSPFIKKETESEKNDKEAKEIFLTGRAVEDNLENNKRKIVLGIIVIISVLIVFISRMLIKLILTSLIFKKTLRSSRKKKR